MNKRVALVILDGWGNGKDYPGNAIKKAHTPFIDKLQQEAPQCSIKTSGEDVGLPAGQMGNSEVGHLNIGAGRVVYQQLVKINRAFTDGSIHKNTVLQNAFAYAKEKQKPIHLIGLVSDGGVHASLDHLKSLTTLAAEHNFSDVFVHAFLDGRDTDPKSGIGYLSEVEEHLNKTTGTIASVIGRYYAMDRDKRWERVKKAYDLLIQGEGSGAERITDEVKKNYEAGITDEFMEPIFQKNASGETTATIKPGDVVINFNFRTDRGRQITMALTQQDFPNEDMHKMDLHYLTLTNYDQTFNNVEVVFENEDLHMTLGEVLAQHGRTQYRIAETEKYPHVTFFFSGGREEVFTHESRTLCPSPKVATYDLKPEMSAHDVRDAVLKAITEHPDFLVVNFANPDMVGHTGDINAVVKALETVDHCTSQIVEAGLKEDYTFIITADHGNAEYMVNEDGSPNTAHTTNPVPLFIVDAHDNFDLKDGRLADIAPTVLQLLGLPQPNEMNGVSLI